MPAVAYNPLWLASPAADYPAVIDAEIAEQERHRRGVLVASQHLVPPNAASRPKNVD
jgi:hypothetical protein